VVLGADATNEDNFVAARMALDFLETGQLYLAAEPEGEADHFLRHADPNPNRAGATACGRGRLRGAGELAADLQAGTLSALYVVGDKLHLPAAAREKLAGLELSVVQASHATDLQGQARVVLPAACWAEVDGSITNAGGDTQRLYAAVPPPDFARPHWQILVQVARQAGLMLDYASPRAVFEEMKQEIELFRGADWGKAMAPVLLRYANSRG
jgi:anaerobic selenocysteine-containing dehydrogenase